jgi:FG-GAP repeat.
VRPVDELVYTVSSSDQALVAATLEGSSLSLTPSGSSAGTATITIRATSVADPTSVVEESFDVTVSGVNQANSLLSFTSGGKWMLSQNTGSGMVSSEFASWSTAIDWVDTLTGDFNGDGLVDVLGRNAANGAWYASLNQGDGTGSTRFMATWSAGANWQNLQVGDFNGDGIDDIAGRASSGAWYAGLGRADGSGLTTKYMTAWSRLVSWGDIRVGDFNGDGTDDIAGRLESNGQWWAAITAADGSAVNHNMGTWSTALSWNDVAVGDFNGDGIDDIVGRTSNSGAWYAALGPPA